MTKQIYLDRIEKGIKILRTYGIMINGQQNYKTLPHYMKVFGDFCLDYLKYKTVGILPDINAIESVSVLLDACKENNIEVAAILVEQSDLMQKCKEAQYTDVSECIGLMPVTVHIIARIMEDLKIEA